MTPAEVIREARNVLFERGWCKKELENDAGECCLLGAALIAHHGVATGAGLIPGAAWAAIGDAIGDGSSIATFNNAPTTTFADVIDVLDRAEKIAESREVSS